MKILIVIPADVFAFRQFIHQHQSDNIEITVQDFIREVNEIYRGQELPLIDGYAPFCKHVFIENFTTATPEHILITEKNRHLIKSGYEARRPQELSVLQRWIDRSDLRFEGISLQPAKFLDLILYSKEQIDKEDKATGKKTEQCMPLPLESYKNLEVSEYSIISIKAQDVNYELPMLPITAMRNCLINEGGSGVPINRDEYYKCVAYWKEHCVLR